MKNRGFTLIEVLLAMTLTAVLVSSVYVTFSHILVGRQKIKDVTERERQIYFMIDLISTDLRNSYLTVNRGSPVETHKTIFKSEPENPVDHLTFTTLNHVKMAAGAKQCDQTEIEYFGGGEDGENVLYRRESLWVDEDPERGGNVYPIFKGFESIKFEYWHTTTKEWAETWNTESLNNVNTLPPKVKITVVVNEGEFDKKDYKIETVVKLKLLKPLSL
ncbi:prepilin-type N-terminal cleavage/methylation domain-containing protein [bacterium]|nr:prepilin-type N-terminal cleavage/methylation domain-containing protein [bacterium]